VTDEPVKLMGVVIVPTQYMAFEGADTEGVGLMVIVNVLGVPEQPFAVGVTVIVAVMGFEVAFVGIKAAILPTPLVAMPIPAVLFVQL
jgi:hypothetical protein